MAAYAKSIVAVLIGVLTVVQSVLISPPVSVGSWVAALSGPLLTVLGVWALPNQSAVPSLIIPAHDPWPASSLVTPVPGAPME